MNSSNIVRAYGTADVVSIDNKDAIEQRLDPDRFALSTYRGTVLHEISHLLVLENPAVAKKLENAFNKSVVPSNSNELTGFVSRYAHESANVGNINEDIAETVVYWLADKHYADDDALVQAKVAAVKEALEAEYCAIAHPK